MEPKSRDGLSETSSLRESIKEGREKRAELRANANAKRIEEETKRQESDSVTLRKVIEEEMRSERDALDAESKAIEAERKKLEEEKLSLSRLREETNKLIQENEEILKQIQIERAALQSKAGERSSDATYNDDPIDKDEVAMDKTKKLEASKSSDELMMEDGDDEEKPTSKTGKGGKRKSMNGEMAEKSSKQPRSSSAGSHVYDEGNEDDETHQVVSEGENEHSRKRPRRSAPPASTPTVKPAVNGHRKSNPSAPAVSSVESKAPAGRKSTGSTKSPMVTQQDKEEEEDHEEEEEGSEQGSNDEEDADEEEGNEGSAPKTGSSKKGKSKPKTGARGTTRKPAPIQRYGKFTSGKAPRALGYINKGKFGFVPPSGTRALSWRVRVYWKDDKKYYEGMVDAYRNGRHKIMYDDGDIEWLTLENEMIDWFVPEGAEFSPLHIDPYQAFV